MRVVRSSAIWLLGWISLLLCIALIGKRVPLCAHAHGRPERVWQLWVSVWDAVMLAGFGEHDHCAEQARKWAADVDVPGSSK